MPDRPNAGKYWQPTEYKLPKGAERDFEDRPIKPPPPPKPAPVEPVQYPVTPRKVGPMAPKRQGGTVIAPGGEVVKQRPKPLQPETKSGYKRRGTIPVPKAEEDALRTEARAKFPDDQDRQDAYVYGTMRKRGWRPEHHSPWDGRTYKHWYFGKCKV